MATINVQKIGSVATVAPGSTSHFTWNNPPWDTMLSYTAYPVPPSVTGPHGAASGTVAVTRVSITFLRDHYNGDKKYVIVEVTNTGSGPTGYDLYESWIS